jgi:transcriptional regulator with XRE-family HTH domain
MTIGERVRAERMRRGWSLVALAEKTGWSKSYLCQLEMGRRDNPTLDLLTALAIAFGMTIQEIATGQRAG